MALFFLKFWQNYKIGKILSLSAQKCREKNFQEALHAISEGMIKYPDASVLYFERGSIYQTHLKKNQAAIEDYSQAIKIDNKNARYYSERAKCFWYLERYDDGIKDLTLAIELDSKNKKYYYERAKIYDSMGTDDQDKVSADEKYQKSINDYTKCLEIDPSDETFLCKRALGLQMLRRYDEALSDINSVIQKNVPSPVSIYYEIRANIFFDMKQLNEALEDFNRAIGLGSQSKNVTEKIAEIKTILAKNR